MLVATYDTSNPDFLGRISDCLRSPVPDSRNDMIESFFARDAYGRKGVPFGQGAIGDARKCSGDGARIFIVDANS